MTKDYAHLSEQPYNIDFTNILTTYILPQRAYIFGLFIGIIALHFLWKYWNNGTEKNILYFGLLTSILPLIHTHSFITMCMVAFFLFLGEIIKKVYEKDWISILYIIRKWTILFLLPILIIALPQFLIVYPGDKDSYIKFNFGWMKGNENIFIYWIRNLLPQIFVFAIAYYYAPRKFKTFYNSFAAIFILSNIIVFQPNTWDNMKFMIWWYLVSSVLTGILFKKIAEKFKWKGYILIVLILISMTISGVISILWESYASARLFSEEDISFGKYIRENTNPEDIFLTADNHNNPVPCLTGRKILMGFTGWLWSYGIDYSQRQKDISDIYKGKDDALYLINKYNINYIVYDSNRFKSEDKVFLNKNFTMIYESTNKIYNLYRVK